MPSLVHLFGMCMQTTCTHIQRHHSLLFVQPDKKLPLCHIQGMSWKHVTDGVTESVSQPLVWQRTNAFRLHWCVTQYKRPLQR